MLGLCDEILKIDGKIRFVVHLDDNMNLVEKKLRPRVKSLTEKKTDEEIISRIDALILNVCSKLQEDLGICKNLRIEYQNASIIFVKIPNAIVGMSLESGPTTPVLNKIAQKYGSAPG